MTLILLRFEIDLQGKGAREFEDKHGPTFYKWLPDGRADCIEIPTGHERYTLEVWFERRGYVYEDTIIYDESRREVDPSLMRIQGKLEAGPLMGLLEIKDPPEGAVNAIRQEDIGSGEYKDFGKNIIQKCLSPNLRDFLRILRVRYGQYWVPQLPEWDSRSESLGAYCNSKLHLEYKLGGQEKWKDFLPTRPSETATFTTTTSEEEWSKFLTQQDWKEIQELVYSETQPSSMSEVYLIKTHKLTDQEKFRRAFISGVTALELACDNLIEEQLEGLNFKNNVKNKFEQGLSLKDQMTILANKKDINGPEIAKAREAVKIRNDIIHEGKSPPKNPEDQLRALIVVVSKLMLEEIIKLPKDLYGQVSFLDE